MHVNDILKAAAEKGASDLHLRVGSHPVVRVDGRLQPLVELKRLQQEDTLACAFAIMSGRQKDKFKDSLEIDIAHSVPGLGRFRVNVFQQRGTVGLVLRVIPVKVLGFEELMLPEELAEICDEQRGLILCAGTTGSGKSTTLAAMIEHVNATRSAHVVTIEDPIEFLHRDKKAMITQREVDVDTRSYAAALRSSLRQDPDVILVGQLRDVETIEIALTAAETGHLVLSTMHTLDAAETIARLVAGFPATHQTQVRLQVASVLKALLSLRLLSRRDGKGRVPAIELLRSTPRVRECIERDELASLPAAIEAGPPELGMQTFDQSIARLARRGLLAREEALRRATDSAAVERALAGGDPGASAP